MMATTTKIYIVAWALFLIGMALWAMEWYGKASSTVGWVGLGIAAVGTLVSFIPHWLVIKESPDEAAKKEDEGK